MKVINTSRIIKTKKNLTQKAIRLNQKGLKNLLFGNVQEAINSFEQSITADYKYPDPYFNLGNIYIQNSDFHLSEKFYEKAIQFNNKKPDYFYNLAITKYNLNKIEEAIINYQKSIELEPENFKAYKFLGNCYKDLKNFPKAISTYNDWQRIDIHNPEPIFNKSLIHIRNGRFDIGWLLYENGLKNNIREPFDGFYREKKNYWNGAPFDGTLLVYGEQGLGDQIVFGTLIPELLLVQTKVILKVDRRLMKLFKSTFPEIVVVSENETISENKYQKFISMGSLCKFYRKTTDDFMKSQFKTYSTKNTLNKYYRDQLKKLKNLKIGISWFSFSEKSGNQRSLKDEEVSKIINYSDNSFINLQYGDVSKSISNFSNLPKKNFFTLDGLDLNNDLDNIISVIKHCDLIITIDNTIAHLAGALGKQVWILLPYSADFRWMENVTATLWYENALLIRQNKPGSWDNVFQTIKQAFS